MPDCEGIIDIEMLWTMSYSVATQYKYSSGGSLMLDQNNSEKLSTYKCSEFVSVQGSTNYICLRSADYCQKFSDQGC